MALTYEKIQSTTLGSSSSTITFTSIPGTYTDLRLVIVAKGTAASDVNMVFNSSGSACSWTQLWGDGATAGANRITSALGRAYITLNYDVLSTTIPFMYTVDILSYTAAINKTCLTSFQEDKSGSGYTGRKVGLWRDTSAITSITLNGTDFATGTTATLYGILKA